MKIKQKNNLLLYLPILYYFIGPFSFFSYLYSIKVLFSKIKTKVAICFILVSLVFLISCLKQDILDAVRVFRFFWGWIFFYMLFSSGVMIDRYKLLVTLSIFILIEALLVNTLVNPENLVNYPSGYRSSHIAPDGRYQRPYSFGASASVTSAIVVSLISSLNLSFRQLLVPTLAVISCMSGTGFFLLFLNFLFSAKKNYQSILIFILFLSVITFGGATLYKYSLNYLFEVVYFKLLQISASSVFESTQDLLFGGRLALDYAIGGDFQLLSFFELNGIIGVIALCTIILLNTNRVNFIPIFLLILGTMHYGAIFYLPGQFFFGYFLAFRRGA